MIIIAIMTVQEAYTQLSAALQQLYEAREAAVIANLATEHITGYGGSSRIMHKQEVLSGAQQQQYHRLAADLLAHRPLQYVLNEAYFDGLLFYVDERVLIPRPETEELVHWVIEEMNAQSICNPPQQQPLQVLDIGTGSGCIPIALKKRLAQTDVSAVDVSAEALAVARTNAERLAAEIHFTQTNILNASEWRHYFLYDIIISNPPYITGSEAAGMHNNVLQFEPHLALFVPDSNPLLFYEAISRFGCEKLKPEGMLFFEINEALGDEVVSMLAAKGYRHITLRKDMQGKDRMVKATAPRSRQPMRHNE